MKYAFTPPGILTSTRTSTRENALKQLKPTTQTGNFTKEKGSNRMRAQPQSDVKGWLGGANYQDISETFLGSIRVKGQRRTRSNRFLLSKLSP
jgi:hypothetical protein